ncbi:SH3 domain-containing protein [uncultured Abyssibacter sp.]|uniref:SH3 domain-containing protein n=1 Tax=uncultured Abyssibacter sp. TaxID=2320202 RepID=UPI0032B21B86
MHPIVLILLAAIVIAAVFGLVSISRGTPGADEDPEPRLRRVLVTGLAVLLAINVAMAGFGWFVVQSSGQDGNADTAGEALELSNRLLALEARLQTLESRVSAGEDKPVPAGDRIVPAIESVIVRRSPGGESLTHLPGGSGVDVSYCMARREAGQYWCEIRTPSGETGWVPRTLIEPPPELSGERGG